MSIDLTGIKAILLDMDGVLVSENLPIVGSAETTHVLHQANIEVYYVTNNTNSTQQQLADSLSHIGCYVESVNQIYSSIALLKHLLIEDNIKGNVLVMGSYALCDLIDSINGIRAVSVVGEEVSQNEGIVLTHKAISAVVCGFDKKISYYRASLVVAIINKYKCPTYFTNKDKIFPNPNYDLPATGSFLSIFLNCISNDVKVKWAGKPNKNIGEIIKNITKLDSSQIMMIGDNLQTDIEFGNNCLFRTILVETGIHKRADIKDENKPTYVLPRLADIIPYIPIQ